jgi:hypothetical protein
LKHPPTGKQHQNGLCMPQHLRSVNQQAAARCTALFLQQCWQCPCCAAGHA